MSQISRKNSYRKNGFPIFGQKFYVARKKLVFWPPFCNCISDFRFFFLLYFGSFGLLYQWPDISPPNSFGKVLFWVRVHRDPPLTTNGSAEGLDHLSVNAAIRPTHYEEFSRFWGTGTIYSCRPILNDWFRSDQRRSETFCRFLNFVNNIVHI